MMKDGLRIVHGRLVGLNLYQMSVTAVRADWKEEKAHMNVQVTNTLDMNTVDWEVWH